MELEGFVNWMFSTFEHEITMTVVTICTLAWLFMAIVLFVAIGWTAMTTITIILNMIFRKNK